MSTTQKRQLQAAYAVAGEELPIIDLGPYLNNQPGAAETTAAEMRDALEHIGFFFIINHGIATALRERTVEATARFYALPPEARMALKINRAGLGYIPSKGEFGKHSRYYTGTKKPDLSEAFLLQRDWGARLAPHPQPMAGGRARISGCHARFLRRHRRPEPAHAAAVRPRPGAGAGLL